MNLEKFTALLDTYKATFSKRWSKQKRKWVAIKRFQDRWDIDSPDFYAMFENAMSKTSPVMKQSKKYLNSAPLSMIAKDQPENIRTLFSKLFNEEMDLNDRIKRFCSAVQEFIPINMGNATVMAINYLGLRYPDKYYVFRPGICRAASKQLGIDCERGAIETLSICGQICAQIQNDIECKTMLNQVKTNDCWPDNYLHILTIDFLSFVAVPQLSDEGEMGDDTIIQLSMPLQEKLVEKYSNDDFLQDVFISEQQLNSLLTTLHRKKNVILQGAPGVGKTFMAKRLAWAMMGKKNEHHIQMVQFHQNYSYEDFIMGYRPQDNGFQINYGVFYQFCKTAAQNPGQEYFFLIDEINRGNLSKIFGELLMLIENNYRNNIITLPLDPQNTFYVPENLYIIGMMNTADRSLAMIDYALRRRFSFFTIEPGFDSDKFKAYQQKMGNKTFDLLIDQIRKLNEEIAADDSLGRGFQIGHSYFCNISSPEECTNSYLKEIVDFDIAPMLEEYWFDDKERYNEWAKKLGDVFYD